VRNLSNTQPTIRVRESKVHLVYEESLYDGVAEEWLLT
jgi:hypothetical protein